LPMPLSWSIPPKFSSSSFMFQVFMQDLNYLWSILNYFVLFFGGTGGLLLNSELGMHSTTWATLPVLNWFLVLFVCLFYCCDGNTLWHLQKFLQYIKYIILEFIPSIILFYPSPPFL
jgi:hypothetical protein